MECNADYAYTDSLECTECSKVILKGSVKISYLQTKEKRVFSWYHSMCFFKKFKIGLDEVNGINDLRFSDISEIKKNLEVNKKRKSEEVSENSDNKKPKLSNDTEEFENHNNLFWKTKDQLQDKMMNSNLITFLKENQQTCLTEKRTELINACADCLCYGALEKCTKCNSGQMEYCSSIYKCTKCEYMTTTPKRTIAIISLKSEEFKIFSPKLQNRILTKLNSNQLLNSQLQINGTSDVPASTSSLEQTEHFEVLSVAERTINQKTTETISSVESISVKNTKDDLNSQPLQNKTKKKQKSKGNNTKCIKCNQRIPKGQILMITEKGYKHVKC